MPAPLSSVASRYAADVARLYPSPSTTEESYYPAIRDLFSGVLASRRLPFQVRIATSERRGAGGTDRPDFALYDREDFVSVFGEVKLPDVEIEDLAASEERENQIGRYLARTGVVLLATVRSVGLLACKPGYRRDPQRPVPPEDRDLLDVADLWESQRAVSQNRRIPIAAMERLAALVERAVTEFAPIAEASSLALILAHQARRAKEALPATFEAVAGLLEDYRTALGLTFDTREGSEFFRSSLIQTAFYSLFAGWTLWHRANDGTAFEWDRIDRYLKIPFLGKLFYEFRHPDRLAELGLAPHLDRAVATLGRVDRSVFFNRFSYSTLDAGATAPATAITYFYEPFLEAFDPDLRKELGVWYTPPEVVQYQVRKIDRLLRDHLNCPHGFADKRVVVLDPACGTGAYLLEVLRCIAEEIRARGDEALLGAELLQAVTDRVIGFEILTAPFVVAQLQLYLLLSDLGAAPPASRRPAVFLTNALTGWEGSDQIKLNFPELKEEHESARQVKQDARIIVVLGNPPYNRFAGIAIAEEADLVDHYKGITRVPKRNRAGEIVQGADGKPVLVQQGKSLLYMRWAIVKHLLDDLYIRFFRLGEKRIAEAAGEGIVSFISNSSYLMGRSHPLMRESLLTNFDEIWIDNMHGNRLASERTPWGDSCETLFSFNGAAGIKVGTSVSTFLRRQEPGTRRPAGTPVQYRDFWGRADAKRAALLESLDLDSWSAAKKKQAAEQPSGPREYETIYPAESARWLFAPREENVGYEAWPALDEIMPTSYQGINPNRGLSGSVIDHEREVVQDRMRDYFGASTFAAVRDAHPALAVERARYDPEETWRCLRNRSRFRNDHLVHYLLFPFDSRWIYYESECKLLNESRPEFWENVEDNEFFITVPQPRRPSEACPLFATTLVDLHVYDRGCVCFPRESAVGLQERTANLSHKAWAVLKATWRLAGETESVTARRFVGELFRYMLAVMHAPQYQLDHADALAQDWAHVPLCKDRERFRAIARLGDSVAMLLDPQADAERQIERKLGAQVARALAQVACIRETPVRAQDLDVTVSYYGSAQGRWVEREFVDDEPSHVALGETTGDLFINDDVYFSNIPKNIWTYELGGYQVLKKWLGYRHKDRLGRTLTLPETREFRSVVQRIAAILVVHSELDAAYESAAEDTFTAEELRLR